MIRSIYHSLFLLVKRIIYDNVARDASALAFQSFLAIAPLLAVFFGIAKGFGLDALLEKWLLVELADHQEILSYFLKFSRTTLQQASGGVIAGIGIMFLLFTAIKLLSSVESALSSMWGLTHGRSLLRKGGDYLAILLICPLLLAISSSATIFVTTQLTSLLSSLLPVSVRPCLANIFMLFPFLTSTILFSLVLYVMPCSPIRFRFALISGAMAALSFQVIQSGYILFQLNLTKVSTIYGSFVALPLFLVWLWISWFIVLVAGELCVFFQEKGWRTSVYHYSYSLKENLEVDVEVLSLIKKRFSDEDPITLKELLRSFSLPIRAITGSMERLQSGHFIHTGAGLSGHLIPSKKAEKATPLSLLFQESAPPILSDELTLRSKVSY